MDPVAASQVAVEAPPEAQEEAWEPPRGQLPLGHQRVPVRRLRRPERNPRRGDVATAVASLQEFGQHRPVVVQQATEETIVGNHIFDAIHALGWEELDIYVVDDDDLKALRRGVADNAVGDKAKWDNKELAELMEEIGEVPGYSTEDIDKLLKQLEASGDIDATFPVVPHLNEHYELVLIFVENDTDFAWLETKLQLRTERSYKSSQVKKSYVVTVSRLQELWGS